MKKSTKIVLGVIGGVVSLFLLIVIAIAIVVVMFSSDLNLLQTTEPQPNIEIKEEFQNNELEQQELEIVYKTVEATLEFVMTTSSQLVEYTSSGDILSTMTYCSALLEDGSLNTIQNTFVDIEANLKTDKAKEIFKDTKVIFEDYVKVIERVAEGRFDDATINMINDISDKIGILNDKLR